MNRKPILRVGSFGLFLLIIWLLVNSSTPTISVRYRVTDLGPRGKLPTFLDINNNGDILEVSSRGNLGFGSPRIRCATGDSFQDIPLNGFDLVGSDLNNHGQVVVGASTEQGMRVALWSLKGEMVEVGLLPSVSGEIQLFGLNDFGSLIGNTILTSGSMTSFLIRPDMSVEKIQSIIKEPILWASDLNNYEDIIGVSALKDPSTGRAWIWNGTGGITWLGSLGPFHSLAIALGVNNHRQVVGISSRSGQVGKLYDRLATQIKSWFPTMTLPRKRYHAFLWEKGKMYSLDSLINSESGWELEYAWNINDLGQIVGEGALNGITHMFLLTPINDSSSDDGG